MTDIIAINIALLPDQAMVERALVMNGRIRRHHPQSFALDRAHLPHVTLWQAFVLRNDIEAIWRQIAGIVSGGLRAEGFDFHSSGELGTCGFDLSLPPWLESAHDSVGRSLAPYLRDDGDARAFAMGAQESATADRSIAYVQEFSGAHSGPRYHPHLTLGTAPVPYLESLKSEDFAPFDFGIDALALCQLGAHGTCRKVLQNT